MNQLEQIKKLNQLDEDQAKALLNELFKIRNSNFTSSIKNHAQVFLTKFNTEKLSVQEFVFRFIHEIQDECESCGKQLKFLNYSRGFGSYCGIKCSTNSEKRKEKFKNTSILNHGSDHPLKNESVLRKIQDTNQKKFGHKCNLHGTQVKEEIQNKIQEKRNQSVLKAKNTNLNRHGVEWQTQRNSFKQTVKLINFEKLKERDEKRILQVDKSFKLISYDENLIHRWKHSCGHEFVKKSIQLSCPKCTSISSRKEVEFVSWLSSIYSGQIRRNVRLNSRKTFDCYLPDLKLAFEFNGIYWHQEKFDKKRMLEKTAECEKHGIRLIHIWENEWDHEQISTKLFIKSLISREISSGEIQIKQTSFKEIESFLNERIIEDDNDYRYHSVFVNGVIQSVLITQGNTITNFVSTNLNANHLTHLIEQLNMSEITVKIDRMKDDGSLWEQAGFKLVDILEPDYFVTNSTGCKLKTQVEGSWKCFNSGYKIYKKNK